ncbi:MAG: DUF58 domain-containing protein [Ectothiorhodospiraceae bacterium]|nr:DUF58 domain-containing protein [Ectothiorhodospiraceae bacterium]
MRLFAQNTRPVDATVDGDNLVHVSPSTLIALRGAGESLTLKASRISARQSGNYLSRFKGRGMEFDEARLYQPGDDVRTMDWRVTARTGKPHTKLYCEERERAVLTWVDMRPTMFFATRGAFKSVIAARAAALLGWSANRQGDRLGGLVFNADTHHELRPKRGKSATLKMMQLISTASRWQSEYLQAEQQKQQQHEPQIPDADNALARIRRVAKPGSLIFLISDFRHLGPQAESHLAHLSRHNDVVLFHVYDSLEQALPARGQYRVAWGERSSVFSGGTASQNKHRELFEQHCQQLQEFSRFPGVHYLSCATHEDVLQRLQLGLRRR